ncbi:MAG: ATP-binding cassette domain-containing protein [Oscillospiraceae bacterium]|nr:ATP-binding cassette domain-containing protein [Oscillospiraceae bacterium]
MEILSVENLSFRYPQTPQNTLSEISFSVQRGELIAICGATGSGKSTLLRMLKPALVPLGELSGNVSLAGTPLPSLSPRDAAAKIGYVMQRPEQQIVTDKVWHELAFGLENLGLSQSVIARRTAEIASYFGIEHWFDKDTASLSGGQKQLLNLAAVMVMQPEILILDEPTAQLDPIAASEFLTTLKKLNEDFSLTILIAEHRLEELVPMCDRLMVLEHGKALYFDDPRTVIPQLQDKPEILCAMPAAARLCAALGGAAKFPLTVREGRAYLEQHCKNVQKQPQIPDKPPTTEPALEFREVCFRYERELPDVLQSLNLTVQRQEIFCMLGGNGSGKTTALQAGAGLLRVRSGSIRIFGKRLKDYKNQSLYWECLALLPQDVQTVFLKNTVREELAECGEIPETLPFDIRSLYDKHPYDLSGGEQQLAALAKVLAQKPQLLLLDEPTKGLDAHAKSRFIGIVKQLRAQGMTIVIVTHDVELAALCADRCALFFRGSVVSVDTPQKFFAENSYYTTAVSRMTRGLFENAVTVEDAVRLCRQGGQDDA